MHCTGVLCGVLLWWWASQCLSPQAVATAVNVARPPAAMFFVKFSATHVLPVHCLEDSSPDNVQLFWQDACAGLMLTMFAKAFCHLHPHALLYQVCCNPCNVAQTGCRHIARTCTHNDTCRCTILQCSCINASRMQCLGHMCKLHCSTQQQN